MKDEETAEEYAEKECCATCKNINHSCKEKCECWIFAKQGFLAGLKAGRPQWHYVKDCLPQKRKLDIGAKSETVYVATRGYGIYMGYYNFSRKVWYLADNDYQEINEVYAWCELPVPPKEIE